MTKVKFRNLNKVLKNIDKVFSDTLSDQLMNEVGEDVVKRIKGMTRKGLSLPRVDKRTATTTQSPRKQQRLSEGYIEYREALKRGQIKPGQPGYVRTASGGIFRPAKSNLTLTGQLIDSIRHLVNRNRRSKKVEIDVTGIRDDGKTNKEVAKDLADRQDPRLFLGLDGKGIKVVRQKILRLLRRNIRNFNK